MNKFIGLGNLTKDPVLKKLNNGNNVCEFSLAINNKANNSVFYIDAESWGNVAENCNRFLSKGRKVLIEGRLLCSNWKSKNGESRSKIYCRADLVTFLDNSNQDNQQKNIEQKAKEIIEDDQFADIPF
ncbi:MAG: single-stranded DNA-binding protein [Flavobacteriia bacterium]|nr:single-stranded DNA-binding protein [Flavobacteriia bacterium]